ncbi:hypothetical protein [Kribbella sp. NPDC004536]|uniref:hypothetical protein n=1 Tax=Kribbella sp. NPDC004536 TaxID=3364106 RepID=UPI0036CC650B
MKLAKIAALPVCASVLIASTLVAGSTASATAVVRPAARAQHAPRGQLVSVVPIEHLSAAELTQYLRQPASYGVDAYRVVYRTITPQGQPTTASGLVAVPRSAKRRLDLVTFLHGTNATRNSTASVLRTSPDRVRSLMFAGAGFAVAAPDLLGLGVGPGRHPYGDTASEISASADQLVAARELTTALGRSLRPGVLVTGFSEGGRITLSLGRALQREQVPGFTLRALAPVAGPYDLLGVELPALVDGRVSPFVATPSRRSPPPYRPARTSWYARSSCKLSRTRRALLATASARLTPSAPTGSPGFPCTSTPAPLTTTYPPPTPPAAKASSACPARSPT